MEVPCFYCVCNENNIWINLQVSAKHCPEIISVVLQQEKNRSVLYSTCLLESLIGLCWTAGCRSQIPVSGRDSAVPLLSLSTLPVAPPGCASRGHNIREQFCSSWEPLVLSFCKAVSPTWDQLAHQSQPMIHTCLKGVSCVLSGNRQHAFPLQAVSPFGCNLSGLSWVGLGMRNSVTT